jgi:hypothetical protein
MENIMTNDTAIQVIIKIIFCGQKKTKQTAGQSIVVHNDDGQHLIVVLLFVGREFSVLIGQMVRQRVNNVSTYFT